MTDYPGSKVLLDTDAQYYFDDDFEVYQLYRPPGSDTTWVPLHLSLWHWPAGESAPYGTILPYAIPASSVQVSLNTDTTVHPEWGDLVDLPTHPAVVAR